MRIFLTTKRRRLIKILVGWQNLVRQALETQTPLLHFSFLFIPLFFCVCSVSLCCYILAWAHFQTMHISMFPAFSFHVHVPYLLKTPRTLTLAWSFIVYMYKVYVPSFYSSVLPRHIIFSNISTMFFLPHHLAASYESTWFWGNRVGVWGEWMGGGGVLCVCVGRWGWGGVGSYYIMRMEPGFIYSAYFAFCLLFAHWSLRHQGRCTTHFSWFILTWLMTFRRKK